MTSSIRPLRSLLAAAIVLAAAPAFAQSTYSRTVFFGDSLTDAGYYRPLLPASVRAVTGQFTTNPDFVWAQYVAEYYGTNAAANGNGQIGDDYAAGNARVGVANPSALGVAPSLATQASNYLAANGGKADPNALYSVWGGANDLFAIAGGAPVQATIGNAVTAEVGIVASLQNAGARYVMVNNLPDVGITPRFRAGGAAAMAQGTALATAYNTALFSGLKSAGLRVIPVDTFHLLQEVVANPGAYGFTNVTGTACQPQITAQSLTCNPTSYVSADAADTYVFADGVHPTGRTHELLAQYALSILEGPRTQQILTHSAQMVGRSRADQVAWHVDGRPEADGVRWWGNLRGDMQRYQHGDLYDGMAPAGLFGVDWSRGEWVFGGFGGFGRTDADFGNRGGDYTQDDSTLGGFAGWYGEHAWVNAQVSYTWLSYDVTRKVNLGPATIEHKGSPDGSNLTAALQGGYEFGEGSFKHGPVAAAIWQKVKLDGYTESNPNSSALGYSDRDVESMVGRIGWKASIDAGTVKPYLQATYDHEFKKNQEATAWLQTMSDLGEYAVPGINFDRNYASVVLGARTKLWGFESNVGLATTTGQSRAHDTSLFVNFGGSF
ncbi:autotransporter domain-containing esterase [Xanthomonas sacchari]|uniref:autotransporter domain-containing esterase n=1 Tax=Xanthomonas TaxID=338 RepID=UPI0003717DC7|nr:MULTISPECIES: autotransporter domain-containing esterase [Xanthomonas]KAA8921402.1 autotransporter domain-containing esterase [Xanthomonas sontii]KAB7774357.1 autotransporter domain-containing esterase [Xanthomonas sp. LMG 12462]MCW0411087.1 Esterase EstA [Xanthomonas sacchari]MCW0422405.1 Esterase EstA [Xanthomonas sacchari]MCW0462942.1 Esterase EstA [Xanthomonas sacchari]